MRIQAENPYYTQIQIFRRKTKSSPKRALQNVFRLDRRTVRRGSQMRAIRVSEDLFLVVSLSSDDFLTTVKTGGRNVMTTVNFAGCRFDSQRRVRQKIVSTVIAALVGRFLILLNSHGNPT